MNDKYKCPSPETMYTDTLYSFTLNPQEQLEGSLGRFKLNACKTWYDKQMKLFTQLCNCTISVVPEISSKARWHMHGVIMIKDVMLFFLHDVPKLMDHGAYEIDTIDDITVWDRYVYKQKHYMEPFLAKENTPYVWRTLRRGTALSRST